jgi:hypothetical protein
MHDQLLNLFLAAVFLSASLVMLVPSFALLRSAFRVAREWAKQRSHARDVLELAVRLRLLLLKQPTAAVEYEPRFWVPVELDTMPERHLLNIASAYEGLRAAGLSHDAAVERMEIWRSRYGAANLELRHSSLGEYLAYRARIEFQQFPRLSPVFLRAIVWLFRRHAALHTRHRRRIIRQSEPSLKRRLYTLHLQGHELTLSDQGQLIPIGWTDLERYLESDTIAVQVMDRDEIWSYSSRSSAGLALVRGDVVVEISELANFRHRRPLRRRPNGAH